MEGQRRMPSVCLAFVNLHEHLLFILKAYYDDSFHIQFKNQNSCQITNYKNKQLSLIIVVCILLCHDIIYLVLSFNNNLLNDIIIIICRELFFIFFMWIVMSFKCAKLDFQFIDVHGDFSFMHFVYVLLTYWHAQFLKHKTLTNFLLLIQLQKNFDETQKHVMTVQICIFQANH